MKKNPPTALKLKKMAEEGQSFQFEEGQNFIAIVFSAVLSYFFWKLSPISCSNLLDLRLGFDFIDELPFYLIDFYQSFIFKSFLLLWFFLFFKSLISQILNISLRKFSVTARISWIQSKSLNPLASFRSKADLIPAFFAKLLILNTFLLLLFLLLEHNISKEKIINFSGILPMLLFPVLLILIVELVLKCKFWRKKSWMSDLELREELRQEQKSLAIVSKEQEELQMLHDLPAKVKSCDFIVVS